MEFSNIHINPETLHDPKFDKKKGVSDAHEKMEKFQERLKKLNEEIMLKSEFAKGLEKREQEMKQRVPLPEKLNELENAISDVRAEIRRLKEEAEEIEGIVGAYFGIHMTQNEMLDSIDENKTLEN